MKNDNIETKSNLVFDDLLVEIKNLGYSNAALIAESIFVYYLSGKVYKSYKLHRDNKPVDIAKISMPPELKINYSDNKIIQFLYTKYRDSIFEFEKVMIDNFPKENLVNFYNNIQKLRVNQKNTKNRNPFSKGITVAYYVPETNCITICDEKSESSIYHELFHMASAYNDDNNIYVGFYYKSYNDDVEVGKSINEGYTELLTKRYFSHRKSYESYAYSTVIAELLEYIVGKEKMANLYFNCNFLGLIEELKKYASEEDIMKFIADNDFLVKRFGVKRKELFESKTIAESLSNINDFLISCYIKKIQQGCENSKLSNEMFSEMADFFTTIPIAIEINHKKFSITEEEEIFKRLKNSNVIVEKSVIDDVINKKK